MSNNVMDIQEIKKALPQRYPFLMLDKITNLEPGRLIEGYKNISINEPYFSGHFPHNPVFPGALTAEAMAQGACILIQKSIKDLGATNYYVANMKIRFFKIVSPGDRLSIKVKSVKMVKMGGVFETEASVDGREVAKGEMTFACK